MINKNNLPKKIPIFPLSNFIIFPRTTVPLNIFEPRYIEMVDQSMKTNRLIGMIQPKSTKKPLNEKIPLHDIGCLGKISSFSEKYFTSHFFSENEDIAFSLNSNNLAISVPILRPSSFVFALLIF